MTYSNQSSGAMPMSLSGLLYKAMSTMSEYDMQMMNQWLQQMKQYAMAYGGWSPDGKTIDVNQGIVGRYLEAAINSADEAGNAIMDDAKSNLVNGITGLVGLGGTAAACLKTGDSALEEQLKDAKAFQNELKSPVKNEMVLQEQENPPSEATIKMNKRIEEWASGDKSQLADFTKDKFNIEAAQIAKTRPEYLKISKNVDELVRDLDNRNRDAVQKFTQNVNSGVQSLNQAGNLGTAAFNVDKAKQQSDSQADNARATILNSLQQQWSNSIDKAQQTGNQFAQDAGQIAAAFGQITQTRA